MATNQSKNCQHNQERYSTGARDLSLRAHADTKDEAHC